MAFSNSIVLAQKYAPLLDEVYKKASLTSVLENPAKVKFEGGNKVSVFKTDMSGLATYSRNSGYVDGDITASWETMTLSKDRGRRFLVDAMDDEETLGMALGTTASEFIRTKVVPEIDAYRFATFAGAVTPVKADITAATDVAALIDAAEAKMGDDEVPDEGRILYISETAYAGLKAHISRTLANESGVSKIVETYNGMPVVRVPQGRFNTKVTLTASGAGGFSPTAGGFKINFMIVQKDAVIPVVKHNPLGFIAPENNAEADGTYIKYRVYHDAFVLDNKTAGIYVHCANTANT